jgi:hypothetical protein
MLEIVEVIGRRSAPNADVLVAGPSSAGSTSAPAPTNCFRRRKVPYQRQSRAGIWNCLAAGAHFVQERLVTSCPHTAGSCAPWVRHVLSRMYEDSWYSFVPETSSAKDVQPASSSSGGHNRRESLLQQPNVSIPCAHSRCRGRCATRLPQLTSHHYHRARSPDLHGRSHFPSSSRRPSSRMPHQK